MNKQRNFFIWMEFKYLQCKITQFLRQPHLFSRKIVQGEGDEEPPEESIEIISKAAPPEELSVSSREEPCNEKMFTII